MSQLVPLWPLGRNRRHNKELRSLTPDYPGILQLLDRVRSGITKPSVLRNAATLKCINNFDVSNLKTITSEEAFIIGVQCLQADHVEGKLLLAGRSDGSLLLHQIKNFTPSATYKCKILWKCSKHSPYGHKYSIECVQWFPADNSIFVTAGFDCRLKIWETERAQPIDTITFGGRIFNFDLSAGVARNCTVAVGTDKGSVSVFELQSGSNIHTLKGHVGEVLSCKWSPLKEYILATGGADNKVLLWDVRRAKSCLMNFNRCNTVQTTNEQPCVNNFTAHTGSVNSVVFVKNGLKLISCGTDNMIRLWDTLTGKFELVDFENFTNRSKHSVQVDTSRGTNPELLFIPCREGCNIYNIETGRLVNTLKAHFSSVNCCYYDPFQRELYSGGSDGLMLIWRDENLEHYKVEPNQYANEFHVSDGPEESTGRSFPTRMGYTYGTRSRLISGIRYRF